MSSPGSPPIRSRAAGPSEGSKSPPQWIHDAEKDATSGLDEANVEFEESRIPELAALIRARHGGALLQRRTSIGKLIFETVFGGSRLRWAAKKSKAHAGFRRLAEALNGSLSKSDLQRCVATHLLCERCPFVLESGRLTVSHCDAVCGLTPIQQEATLLRASSLGWSASETMNEKRRLLGEHFPKGRGRPAGKAVTPAGVLSRVGGLLEEADRAIARGASDHSISAELEDLIDRLVQVEGACLRARLRLEALSASAPAARGDHSPVAA